MQESEGYGAYKSQLEIDGESPLTRKTDGWIKALNKSRDRSLEGLESAKARGVRGLPDGLIHMNMALLKGSTAYALDTWRHNLLLINGIKKMGKELGREIKAQRAEKRGKPNG
jgi:hypothetical protein